MQSESGVRATAENLDAGGVSEISATYLIGCDGAHSDVRHKIDAKFSGDAVVMQTQSTYIRAPQLLGMIPRPAWLSVSLNPRCSGYLFAIDGRERWLVHNWRPPDEDLATLDRDRCIRQILGVESSFEFEILGQEDWTGRRMIAERFRDRRVFLCGDAAHIWVPFAGYGMNAGIADAMNLSWMLAGVIKGWAEPAILDAYEVERQPVTEQVSRYAMNTLSRTGIAAQHDPRQLGGARTGGRRGTSARRQRRIRTQHRPILLRRAQLRLFLQGLSDHRL